MDDVVKSFVNCETGIDAEENKRWEAFFAMVSHLLLVTREASLEPKTHKDSRS